MTTELYFNILNDNKVAISSGKDNFISECIEVKARYFIFSSKSITNYQK